MILIYFYVFKKGGYKKVKYDNFSFKNARVNTHYKSMGRHKS